MSSAPAPNAIRRDLGLQLLAFYLLFVGPVVVASLFLDWTTSRRIESDVKAADLALARAIAQETNTTLAYALQAIDNLAGQPSVMQFDMPEMDALFKNTYNARPDINLVYRLDAKGIMVFHYPLGPGSTVGTDFSFRDYFKAALQQPDAVISQGRISPTTQQPVATAVKAVRDASGNFLGLVATNINLATLSTVLASITAEHRPEEHFNVVIIDSTGRIIAHPQQGFPLTSEIFEPVTVANTVLGSQSGNLIANASDGEETLYSYVPISSPGWGVIVSRPTAAAFATPRAIHQVILLSVGVIVVVGLFFWLALSGQVLRPLERLASFSQTIGLDETRTDEQRRAIASLSDRPDQIGHLIRSLTRMEEAIQARLQELSTLLETSAAVVSTLDSTKVLNRILEQVERLMNIRTCAILALDEQRGVFRVQASRGLSRDYTEQLTISPGEPHSVTLRAIQTGQAFQVSDLENDPIRTDLRQRARAEGYRAVIAVPLNTQHTSPSALLVYHPEPHVFTQQEISLLTSFANHAAMAIENAALYARSDMALREQTRRLEALIQSMEDGLALEDLGGNILYANRRMSEMLGLSPQDVVGAPIERIQERMLALMADKGIEEKEHVRTSIQAAQAGSSQSQVEFSILINNQMRVVLLQMFHVTDTNGLSIGRGQILSDITRNREVDRMKSSLISTVSHELRTPLAAIKGYASTLLADDVHWEVSAQQEFLQIISAETDRLTKLVNDLLDMSRIESGSLSVTRAPSNLLKMVQAAVQRAYPPPGERLRLDIPADLPDIYCDPQRIEVVLRNLLENAAKYTHDDSAIEITARIRGANLVVRVRDEGPGIPAEHSQRVFESFYRLDDGLRQQAPGAGLGLAICKGFIQAHGGEIWLEPQAKGTCIAFSLPVEQLSAAGWQAAKPGEEPETT